jgi:hypothetical protein
MKMTKKGTIDRLEDATMLRDWCLSLLRFIGELAPSSPFFTQAQQGIMVAFEKLDVNGLRIAAKDLEEWARDLPVDQQAKLDQFLVARFGRGLRAEAEKDRREMRRILKRGSIEGEDEYRLLSSRADEIRADNSKARELEQINRLLVAFQSGAMGK